VENLDEFLVNKKQEAPVEIDINLMGTLMGIVYSTSRGIIMQRTQGTILNGVILSVIDPKNYYSMMGL